MDTPRLRILVLGSPLVTWDDVVLKIARQQIRLLLFYLAAQTQPVHRDTLCQIFWPTEGDEKAHKLLREALSKLRFALPDPTVLIAHAGEVCLDPQKVYVDAWKFKQLTDPFLESADVNRDAQLPEWLYRQLKQAYDLCRGPIKIAGANVSISIGYDNFLSIASQQYDYLRLRIEERLASHCIAKGNLDEAILWLGRTVEIDPFNDENNFLVLNCLKDSGRSKDALDYIAYLDNLYQQSLGHPLPESFFAIQQRIKEMPAQFMLELPEWPGMDESPVPFVGRADLLERLRNAYNRKGIVSLRGPSGIGKSRLLQEFYLNLQRKPRLVFCAGKPMVRCSPFEPLIEGFRVAVKPEEWLALPLEYIATLKVLFPELRNEKDLHNSNQQVDVIEDFLGVCEALHQILIQLSKNRPLLLIMDIAVWADEATLEFLSYLSDRDFYRKYGLLVLLSRKEESSQAFEVFVDRNMMLGRLERIDIPPLTNEETGLLMQKMLGGEPNQQFMEKFYQNTGGNPYFMVEGLKSLESMYFNQKEYSSISLYPIPDTIKALINEKTMMLSKNAIKVLRAGAVLGQFFKAEVVEVMEEMPTTEMMEALEDMERYSLVSIRQGFDGTAGYFFDHDQVREVILQEMSPLRKRHLHLSAVNALIKVFGHKPELESIYAYHFEEAGDPEKAFDAWIQAAEFSRTRFAKNDRYYAYNKAFSLVPRLPQELLVEKVENLAVAWGDYAYDLGDSETCLKISEMCIEVGEQIQNPVLLCVGWNGMGRVNELQLKIDDGIDAVKRAQFYCDRIDNLALKLDTVAQLAVLYGKKYEIKGVISICEEALTHFASIKSQREWNAMVNILVLLGLMYLASGWPQKTIDVGEKAVNLSLLVKRRAAKVQAAAILSAGLYYTGEYQKSLQNALVVHDLAEKLDYRWWVSFLEVVMGRSYLGLGDLDKSWSLSQSVLEREKEFHYDSMYPAAFFLAGEIHRLFGDTKTALGLFKQGMEQQPVCFQSLENNVMFAYTLAEFNPRESLTILDELVRKTEESGLEMITWPAKVGKCLVDTSLGHFEGLGSKIDEIMEEMAKHNFGTSAYYGELIKARVENAAGNKVTARQLYQKIVEPGGRVMNLWVRLKGLTDLMSFAESDAEKAALKKDLNRILARIGEKSTQQPLKRLFFSYRKKLLESL
jgi:DNA-binding SARP family transcriptional activator